ncbi:MAG: glycosyltransferase family 4 protein [Pigmentiphaga sp.]|nr:glycosyltransferase family 4 protein [Pigmentiphaga sp.]
MNEPAAGTPPRWRIAFIARRFGARFGGAEAYAEHLLRQLSLRHEVHVFCQEWDSALDLPRTVLPWPRGWPRWLNLWRFSRRCAILTKDFDIVHSHENAPAGHVHGVHVMPVRYSRRQRDRTVWRRLATRFSLRWQAYLAMEAARYRPAPGKRLVAASGLIDAQIGAVYARTAPRTVITPGVALPAAIPGRAEVRRELGLPADAWLAILVANDPWRKGYAAILQAMAMAPGWSLLVVGGEGDTVRRVRAAADEAGLAERVFAWGGQTDVWPWYAAADACVFPTLGDAFGMVPLEAMALGRPVVISAEPYCGLTRHLRHDINALVLDDPRDPAALAAAVRRLLQEDGLARRLGEGGAALAATFGWDGIATAYEREYRLALEGR